MRNQRLNSAVSALIMAARNGETGLTSIYIQEFQEIIDKEVLAGRLEYIKGLQSQLDRVTGILETAINEEEVL